MSNNGQSIAARARQHPPGTIVIPVADLMRYSEFFIDYSQLLASGGLPKGSGVQIRRSGSVVENINMSLAEMPPEHEWAWIMGDDHRFDPSILVRLLEHPYDVVVPLGVKRTPPFSLGIFKEAGEFIDERLGRTYPGYLPYNLDEVPDHPFQVVAAGSGGMLIRRHVLTALGYPYFESSDGVYLNEDLEFCRRIRALGFEVWCDPNNMLGHIGSIGIWPHRLENGRLVIRLDHGGPVGENEVMLGQALEMVQ